MIYKDRLFKIIKSPIFSEKAYTEIEKNNTFVIKVVKDANKKEIKNAIYKIFNVKINKIRTLIVKGQCKKFKNRFYRRKNWKKAYITIKKGQNIDFIGN